MPSFEDVVTEARASWLANYTVGDKGWRLRQLYGLYYLVLNNRDAIVSALANGKGVLITETGMSFADEWYQISLFLPNSLRRKSPFW
jgi:hypothetical protein